MRNDMEDLRSIKILHNWKEKYYVTTKQVSLVKIEATVTSILLQSIEKSLIFNWQLHVQQLTIQATNYSTIEATNCSTIQATNCNCSRIPKAVLVVAKEFQVVLMNCPPFVTCQVFLEVVKCCCSASNCLTLNVCTLDRLDCFVSIIGGTRNNLR
jgi:hypothetical protein